MSDYYYGQGKLYLARRNSAGQALSWRWVGDVSALDLELEFDEKKSKASFGGRLVDVQRYISAINGKVTSTWHEFSKDNLQALLCSDAEDKTPNLANESLPLGIQAGDRISLRYPNIFGLTISTLNVNEDYIVDTLWGVITFLKTPSHQPVIVDYAHVGHASIPLLNTVSDEFSLRYEGVNLAEDKSLILVELYRVKFDLLPKLSLINSESNLGELETSSVILHDSTKLSDPELGQLGRIINFSHVDGITHNGTINYDGQNLHGGK